MSLLSFSYEVMVIASDGGDPPKSGSMVVSIKIVDVNDHAPVFDNATYEVRRSLVMCGYL